MRVLIAFDKFKDALTAPQACAAAADVLRRQFPGVMVDECPLADGGEGFGPILTAATGGRWVKARVTGPQGEDVEAGFGLVLRSKIPPAALARLGLKTEGAPAGSIIGVVEMAEASGLQLVPRDRRNPWNATSAGTGELVRAAVAAGANTILLGVGGSATHDLGLGALGALGLILSDVAGKPIAPPFPRDWHRIVRLSGKIDLPPLYLACDVSNPLLGPRGAAAVYGPQKGLRAEDFDRLESETGRMAQLLCGWAGVSASALAEPGAGAAGGIGFGMRIALGARLVPGADLIADWLGLRARVQSAEVVITGEGRFDRSSAEGKGPGALAALAAAAGKSVHIFAGQVDLGASLRPPGWKLHSITPADMPLSEALASAELNLRRAVEEASLLR